VARESLVPSQEALDADREAERIVDGDPDIELARDSLAPAEGGQGPDDDPEEARDEHRMGRNQRYGPLTEPRGGVLIVLPHLELALFLHVARYLAEHPKRFRSFKQAIVPIAVVVAPACLLIVVEPDLGTALVVAFSVSSLLVAAGVPLRYLAGVGGIAAAMVVLMVLAQPYQQARLLSFLHPWSAGQGAGYQAVQGQIALGSGGLIGVGLGHSVQKVFYLPEAQTDFILAVIGEELGVLGILGVVFLYGMIAYAGLRAARRAADRYAKLLATGLTSLILCQGILNIFVVLGLAPLTGVPLPFISYAPTNLCVMLASIGLLLNIARPGARRLHVLAPDRSSRPTVPAGDAAAARPVFEESLTEFRAMGDRQRVARSLEFLGLVAYHLGDYVAARPLLEEAQAIWRVIVPASAGQIFIGLKTAVPYAVIGAVIGEYIGADEGLGHFVLYSAQTFDAPSLFSGIVVLVTLVFAANVILGCIEKRVMGWRNTTGATLQL